MVSGRDLVLSQTRARIAQCGAAHTKIALIGYSQGSLAVGDAIERMSSSERGTIKGVVHFGDPRFTPFINGAGFAIALGIAGPRPPYRDGVGGRTKSFCHLGDPICGFWYPTQYALQVGTNLLAACVIAKDNCPHMTYRSSDAAAFLAGKI
ncbi:cutinase family protein [Actinocrispum wychmicini]|uniref:Cutinase n=1 Tax=Actinocrispum wychmicini TaxID=1213861 RepID=A0A4R2JV16_9PSEU|nr:cutinase family protein [Actinocrispum wychmicini]TCO64243.1 cutinase [Actinocrispum wychmicini]